MLWLILGLLCPPLLPVIIICWIFRALLDGSPGRSLTPHTPPLRLRFGTPTNDELFQAVDPKTDEAFRPVTANAPGQVLPGALCLVCGVPKAHGMHAH